MRHSERTTNFLATIIAAAALVVTLGAISCVASGRQMPCAKAKTVISNTGSSPTGEAAQIFSGIAEDALSSFVVERTFEAVGFCDGGFRHEPWGWLIAEGLRAVETTLGEMRLRHVVVEVLFRVERAFEAD